MQDTEGHLRRPQADAILSMPAFVLTVDTDQWLNTRGQLEEIRANRFTPEMVVLCQFDSTIKRPVLVATDVAMYIFLRNLVVGYIDRAGSKYYNHSTLQCLVAD